MKIAFLILGAACILFGTAILAADAFLGALFVLIGVVIGLLGFGPPETAERPLHDADRPLPPDDDLS